MLRLIGTPIESCIPDDPFNSVYTPNISKSFKNKNINEKNIIVIRRCFFELVSNYRKKIVSKKFKTF